MKLFTILKHINSLIFLFSNKMILEVEAIQMNLASHSENSKIYFLIGVLLLHYVCILVGIQFVLKCCISVIFKLVNDYY